MVDLVFIIVIIAFFALMVAFVRLCERIIGRDEDVTVVDDASPAPTGGSTGIDSLHDFPITTKGATS